MNLEIFINNMTNLITNIQNILSSIPIRILLIIILWWIISFVNKKIYKKSTKTEKTLKKDFQYACSKLIIGLLALICIAFQFDVVKESAGYILTSTTLLVTLVGFCFQEAFSNAIHGVILAMTETFQVGNRIKIDSNGQIITGYIKGMDMRCVMVEDITTSACLLIPNKIMDTIIVENFHSQRGALKSYILTIPITYDSCIERAMFLIQEAIKEIPQVIDTRTDDEKNNNKPLTPIYVKELGSNGVILSVKIITKTIEDNFLACSEARKKILKKFNEEKNVNFAFPYMQIIEKKN